MLFNGSLNCGSADDILEWRQFEWWVIDGLVFCGKFKDFIRFRLVEGVLFSVIGIVGFLGNTLSIIVLISPQVLT